MRHQDQKDQNPKAGEGPRTVGEARKGRLRRRRGGEPRALGVETAYRTKGIGTGGKSPHPWGK